METLSEAPWGENMGAQGSVCKGSNHIANDC